MYYIKVCSSSRSSSSSSSSSSSNDDDDVTYMSSLTTQVIRMYNCTYAKCERY